MNPIHREAVGSARLHLFQELSTLGQQFAQALLFREGRGRVLPMFPASTARPLQCFGGARSGTSTNCIRHLPRRSRAWVSQAHSSWHLRTPCSLHLPTMTVRSSTDHTV